MDLHFRKLIMNDDRALPITEPDEGFELCYECKGKRICWVCEGTGVDARGRRCISCGYTGHCIVGRGAGQHPLGTEARVDKRQ